MIHERIDIQQSKLDILRSIAFEIVRMGGLNKPDQYHFSPIPVHLIYKPTIDTVIGWELYQPDGVKGSDIKPVIIIETAWDQAADISRLNESEGSSIDRLEYDLQPTISQSEIIVNDSFELLELIHNITSQPVVLNPLKHNVTGLDGDTYVLIIGDHLSQITLSWWEMYPKEWKNICDPAFKLFSLFYDMSVQNQINQQTNFIHTRHTISNNSVFLSHFI